MRTVALGRDAAQLKLVAEGNGGDPPQIDGDRSTERYVWARYAVGHSNITRRQPHPVRRDDRCPMANNDGLVAGIAQHERRVTLVICMATGTCKVFQYFESLRFGFLVAAGLTSACISWAMWLRLPSAESMV